MIRFLKYLSLYFVKGEIKVYSVKSGKVTRRRIFINKNFKYVLQGNETYSDSCYSYDRIYHFYKFENIYYSKARQLLNMYNFDKYVGLQIKFLGR